MLINWNFLLLSWNNYLTKIFRIIIFFILSRNLKQVACTKTCLKKINCPAIFCQLTPYTTFQQKQKFFIILSSQNLESCRALIEGACNDLGGICDFLIQCSENVTEKVNFGIKAMLFVCRGYWLVLLSYPKAPKLGHMV